MHPDLHSIISIHALREEGDVFVVALYVNPFDISIHALREEGDAEGQLLEKQITNFYPRPPRGGRHIGFDDATMVNKFLSTPSARRATCICKD